MTWIDESLPNGFGRYECVHPDIYAKLLEREIFGGPRAPMTARQRRKAIRDARLSAKQAWWGDAWQRLDVERRKKKRLTSRSGRSMT